MIPKILPNKLKRSAVLSPRIRDPKITTTVTTFQQMKKQINPQICPIQVAFRSIPYSLFKNPFFSFVSIFLFDYLVLISNFKFALLATIASKILLGVGGHVDGVGFSVNDFGLQMSLDVWRLACGHRIFWMLGQLRLHFGEDLF